LNVISETLQVSLYLQVFPDDILARKINTF